MLKTKMNARALRMSTAVKIALLAEKFTKSKTTFKKQQVYIESKLFKTTFSVNKPWLYTNVENVRK